MGAPTDLDWAWATRTGGRLSRRQKLELLAPLSRGIAGFAAAQYRSARGIHGSGRLDLDGLSWPDSRLAREADEHARDVLPAWLVQHSYRAYLFGCALARLDAVEVDAELAFVSCMLHDITLGRPTPRRCFAVTGGEFAEQFALARDTNADRAALIGAAIGGHLTPGAADDLADPAGFVSAGSALDVVGLRAQALDRAFLRDVVDRHPRLQLKRELIRVLRDEAAAVPDGRARWLLRYGTFGLLIRTAPLP